MKCPFCNKDNTKVLDSRPLEENNSIRRRRQCEHCGMRFTTYEKVETLPLNVIKKDNRREPYEREKIESAIVRACHKRSISFEEIQKMVDEIENQLFSIERNREIESHKIGEIVMSKLKDYDSVAYVRFASVYREFKDVETFMDELKKLLK